MKRELDILTSCVHVITMGRPEYAGTDILKRIKKEVEELKVLFLATFNYVTDDFRLIEIMNDRYCKLVGSINVLWERARLPNAIAREALMEVLGLKNFLELEYSNFLDKNRVLSNFERFKLESHIKAELKGVKERLRSKKISEPLVFQVEKAFLDLFNETNYPELDINRKEFIDMFFVKLSALAYSEDDKNWNMRIRQLLIKFNCNHMGIYKLLQQEHEDLILLGKDAEIQLDLLYEKEIWVEQIQPSGNLAYNREANDLKSMLLIHLKKLGPHLAKKIKIRRAQKPEKFKFNLSVDELSLVFHYYYHLGAFNYTSKKIAAAAFCAHIRSKGREDVSINSIMKFDKLEQRTAAMRQYKRSTQVQNKVKEDFDL